MSTTATRLRPFGTTIFAEMTSLAQQHSAVNLSQGFPDFDGPKEVQNAAARAMDSGHNQYAPMPGVPVLREAVAEWWKNSTGLDADTAREITITNGCTGALAAAMLGLIEPGDAVVVFEPFYDAYLPDLAMAEADVLPVSLQPVDGRFVFDEHDLRAAFAKKPRAVLLNTPHNPTGKVFSLDELQLIASLCVEHNVIAITDEVYETLTYETDRPHCSLAMLPGMRERTLTLSSIGKTFSLTGWKIGWAIGPEDLTRALRSAHQFLAYAVSTPLQHGAAHALRHERAYIEMLRKQYTAARSFMLGVLADVGFDPIAPEGTYFIIADHSRLSTRLGLKDDVALCRFLTRDIGVAAIPPSAFYRDGAGGKTLVRFAFCKTQATLQEAAKRLAALRRLNP